MMYMKSKYFGYTLRGAGTPYQQWILSELPISASGVYTTDSVSEIAVGRRIPFQSIVLNQIGGKVNANGSISLPQGVYKIEYSGIVSTEAASPVIFDLVSSGTVISETQNYTATSPTTGFSATIHGDGILKVNCCGGNFSIVNSSAVPVTPVAVGDESMRVFVTRLM